jgi:hypothetical protein
MLDCNGEFERQKKKIKKIYFSENYVNEGDFIFDLFPNLTYLNLCTYENIQNTIMLRPLQILENCRSCKFYLCKTIKLQLFLPNFANYKA